MQKRSLNHYPKVSVILLNYNGISDTRACLYSLIKTTYPNINIIVVDNGSFVNEAVILRKEFHEKKNLIRCIRFNKNWGFAGGYNRIIKKVKSKYIVVLNNDTIVTKNWLEKLVIAAEKDDQIGVCQPKIMSLNKRDYFEYAGGAGGYVDKLGYPYAQGRIMFHLEQDNGQYDQQKEIFWASGAAMFIRRQILKQSGLFDEDLFAYVEEGDLCWRIKKAGFKIVVVPKARIYHKGLGTWSKFSQKKTFLIHRNSLIVLLEHLSIKKLLWVFPLRILLDYASIIFYISTGRVDFSLSVISAHFSLIVRMKSIVRKRNHIFWNRNRTLTERDMYPTSIIWEYFIKGKRRYSELLGVSSQIPTIHYAEMLQIKSLVIQKRKFEKIISSVKKAF